MRQRQFNVRPCGRRERETGTPMPTEVFDLYLASFHDPIVFRNQRFAILERLLRRGIK